MIVIQKKMHSISISELILTAIILTLAIILQEYSWLNSLISPHTISLPDIQTEVYEQNISF